MMVDLASIKTLQQNGKEEEARLALAELAAENRDDALVQLETAFSHDSLGYEREAVSYYQRAMALGLPEDQLREAYLTLGSTYRALGEYDKAKDTWLQGLERFPQADEIRIFLAMGLYNLGEYHEAISSLLKIITVYVEEERIKRYRRAINEYAVDLDRSWG